MKTSKLAVAANSVLGKIMSIVGYSLGIFMLLLLIIGVPQVEEGAVGIAVFCIIIIACCALAVLKGIQIKRRIKRFKQYVALISGQHMSSLENIAASTNKTVDFVKKDLRKMINLKFFAQARIDSVSNEIIIIGANANANAMPNQMQAGVELEEYICPGCEAVGHKPKGGTATCDYCGSVVS